MPARYEFSAVACNHLFEFTLVSAGNGEGMITMPALEKFAQEEGVIHGGIITTLADTAAARAVLASIGEDQRTASIDITMKFINAAFPGKGDLTAKAVTLKRGKRTAVLESTVTQNDTVVAKGMFTYILFERK